MGRLARGGSASGSSPARPYQDMDAPISVLAWGRVLELETMEAAQILAFYDRYLDRGPENAR